MKRKSFIILFFSISVVLAVFASNRMSVNEIISENVEALSSGDDFANMSIPIKWPEEVHITPMSWGNDWYGYHTNPNSSNMWNGIPQCTGDKKTCNRPTGQWCWAPYVVSGQVFMELLSMGYYFILIP